MADDGHSRLGCLCSQGDAFGTQLVDGRQNFSNQPLSERKRCTNLLDMMESQKYI